MAFASSLDQVGPVTRNVRDNAILYGIISGQDENDSTTVAVPPVVVPERGDLKGVRIGLPRQLNEVEGIEPERAPYRVREGGSLLCFVRDPDDYRIELIERPPA